MLGVLRGSDVYKDRIKIETGLTRFVSRLKFTYI